MTAILPLSLAALLAAPLSQVPGPAPSAAPPEAAAAPEPLPPSAPNPLPLRYGDRGTSDLSLGLGYSSYAGFMASGGYRYFVVDGLAPGLEAHYFSGGTSASAVGLVLANLRAVPLRTDGLALVLTGRAGRALLAHHGDGWAVGGSGGVVVFLASRVGLEVGYEVLRLVPASFCADLARCLIHGPVFGLRIVF